MLSKPKYGWTTITLGDQKIQASNITDVPYDLLYAVRKVILTGCPFAVKIDTEGEFYTIVFDFLNTHIIKDSFDCNLSLKTVDIFIFDLAKQLAHDFEEYKLDWINWSPTYNQGRINNMTAWAEELKSLKRLQYKRIDYQ